jgi:hypothetical protein
VSGGSYNYLTGVMDLEDLLHKRIDLKDMAERLEGLDESEFPGSTAAAQATRELQVLLTAWETHAETRIGLLKGVWHDVEWWDSNDYGPDQVKTGLLKFLKGEKS